MVLGSKEESKQISYKDSSPFQGEDDQWNAAPKLGKRPHSIHFSILCLVDLMKVNPPDQVMNIGKREKFLYILEFSLPNGHTEIPSSKAKKLNFRCPISGLLRFSPLLNNPT